MTRTTIVTCDVCGKEVNNYQGAIQVSYLKLDPGPYTHNHVQNHFDFCCVEHMLEYIENVGLEKGIECWKRTQNQVSTSIK